PFEVSLVEGMWDEYYAPVLSLTRRAQRSAHADDGIVWTRVEDADVDVGVHAHVLEEFAQAGGAAAKEVAEALQGELAESNADGIVVRAGRSWESRFSGTWTGGTI